MVNFKKTGSRLRLTALRGNSGLKNKNGININSPFNESIVNDQHTTNISRNDEESAQYIREDSKVGRENAFSSQNNHVSKSISFNESTVTEETKNTSGEHANMKESSAMDETKADERRNILPKKELSAVGKDLAKRIEDLQTVENKTLETQGHIALLSGQLCEVNDNIEEAMQHYQSAFALYQEERSQVDFSGPLDERKIVLKMILCLKLLQRRCTKSNDMDKVAKLNQIIESLQQQCEMLMLSHEQITSERERQPSAHDDSRYPPSNYSSSSNDERANSYAQSEQSSYVRSFERMNTQSQESRYNSFRSERTGDSNDYYSTVAESADGQGSRYSSIKSERTGDSLDLSTLAGSTDGESHKPESNGGTCNLFSLLYPFSK